MLINQCVFPRSFVCVYFLRNFFRLKITNLFLFNCPNYNRSEKWLNQLVSLVGWDSHTHTRIHSNTGREGEKRFTESQTIHVNTQIQNIHTHTLDRIRNRTGIFAPSGTEIWPGRIIEHYARKERQTIQVI